MTFSERHAGLPSAALERNSHLGVTGQYAGMSKVAEHTAQIGRSRLVSELIREPSLLINGEWVPGTGPGCEVVLQIKAVQL